MLVHLYVETDRTVLLESVLHQNGFPFVVAPPVPEQTLEEIETKLKGGGNCQQQGS
jgi:hypothetical protein